MASEYVGEPSGAINTCVLARSAYYVQPGAPNGASDRLGLLKPSAITPSCADVGATMSMSYVDSSRGLLCVAANTLPQPTPNDIVRAIVGP